MARSIVAIRPVQEEDAQGLAQSNRSLNSPHAPTGLEAVKRIIAASQDSLSGKSVPTQVNVVAEEMYVHGGRRIVGGGALVKMGSDGEYPILWKPNDDGSFSRFRYTQPTLEFGGASVALDAQNMGVGKGITAARALIARKYGSLFGAGHVLSDFLPPLDNVDTKENIFWSDVIVSALRESGTLQQVMAYCQEKTGVHIEDTSTLSAVIGNTMSDADRNAMIDQFFPETITAKSISPEARRITQSVNGPTEAARANLLKIFGDAFKIIGAFPINGGPNYAAPAELGPTGEGPTPVRIRELTEGRVKMLLFRPLGEGFEGLRNFHASMVRGDIIGSHTIISEETARMTGIKKSDELMRFRL
ncbi:MAG: hypothetical protein NTX63_04990 [Candidatus Peregrinibacteria bacterium]|nr:hypothetical protein [Candidatus Peregrinibacteria bacterium]